MTADLAWVFAEVIAPVVIVGGVGYVVGRARRFDLGPVTGLAVTVLVPAIVFDSLTRPAVPRDLLARLVLHVVLQLVCLGALALVIAWVAGLRGGSQAAFLMATLFSNGGNTGLPIAYFAFGAPGLAIAAGWFAASAISVHTLGIWLAARVHAGGLAALRRLARLPITYAMLAGVIVKTAGWDLPGPVAKATQLLAGGAVAIMLLLLGLELARLEPRAELRGATLASAIRLLVAPPIAWVTAHLVGLQGIALSIAVLQASMPTAVTAALWAMEFGTRPALVTATVVLSTLAAVVTLTVVLAMLL